MSGARNEALDEQDAYPSTNGTFELPHVSRTIVGKPAAAAREQWARRKEKYRVRHEKASSRLSALDDWLAQDLGHQVEGLPGNI